MDEISSGGFLLLGIGWFGNLLQLESGTTKWHAAPAATQLPREYYAACAKEDPSGFFPFAPISSRIAYLTYMYIRDAIPFQWKKSGWDSYVSAGCGESSTTCSSTGRTEGWGLDGRVDWMKHCQRPWLNDSQFGVEKTDLRPRNMSGHSPANSCCFAKLVLESLTF